MSIDLYKLAKERPTTSITITLQDLIYANKCLLQDVFEEVYQGSIDRHKLLKRREVLERLNIVPSTLWRWEKTGYLIPIKIGGQNRYRLSDIERILQNTNK